MKCNVSYWFKYSWVELCCIMYQIRIEINSRVFENYQAINKIKAEHCIIADDFYDDYHVYYHH